MRFLINILLFFIPFSIIAHPEWHPCPKALFEAQIPIFSTLILPGIHEWTKASLRAESTYTNSSGSHFQFKAFKNGTNAYLLCTWRPGQNQEFTAVFVPEIDS